MIAIIASASGSVGCVATPAPGEPVGRASAPPAREDNEMDACVGDTDVADHPVDADRADTTDVADTIRDRPAQPLDQARAIPNMDPTCAPDPRAGMPCAKAFQVCRQSDGNPCNCSSKKIWVCATPCPPDTRTATITMRTCDFPGQFCRRPPPPGSPTSTEADWCICGNHYGWDCLDIPVCKTGVTTGAACTPRSDPRPGADRGRICQVPAPPGQAPELVCLCDVATVSTWKCQPTCPWGARRDGVCDRGSAACALLAPGSTSRGAIVGGIFVAPCTCGAQGTLECGLAPRYDWR